MNVFELMAVLSLNKSAYEKGLNEAQSDATSGGSRIASALGSAGKLVAGALATASAVVVKLGADSVKTGMEFQSSMSQVEATMGDNAHKMISYNGQTVDSMEALTDFAQKMGATTAFTASQASEGLNILAMAGFNATQQMEALPSVLALASAGSLDLGSSADYVTGIMAGFGQEINELNTTHVADLLATMSASAKGTVASFGEGLSTVSGMAKTTGQSLEDVAVALEILGNNNVSASEGGNALSRTLKNLYQATDTGKKGLEALGVSAYDTATGKARPLRDVLIDLQNATKDMSDEARNMALSDIFDSATLKTVPFLIDNCTDAWDNLSESIEGCEGSAQRMADVQLDNLEGDLTLLGSAFDGLKMSISAELIPTLREFVQFGTEGLTAITEAFKSGGLDGAMSELGNQLSQGVSMIASKLPEIVKAGGKLISSFVSGISQAMPEILSAGLSVAEYFLSSIFTHAPETIKCGAELLRNLAEGFRNNAPQIMKDVTQVVIQIVNSLVENAPLLIEAGLLLLEGLGQGILEALPVLISNLPIIVQTLVDSFVSALPLLINGAIQLTMGIVENLPTIIISLIEALPQIIESVIEGLLTCLPQLISGLVTLNIELMAHLPEIIVAIIDSIPEIIDAIIEAFSDLPNRLMEVATESTTSFDEGLQELPSLVWGIFETVITKVEELKAQMFSKAIELSNNFLNMIIDVLINLPPKMANIFSNALNKVATWGSNMISKGISTAVNFVNYIINNFLNLPPRTASMLTDVLNRVASWSTNLISKGISTATSFVSNIISNMASLPSKFMEIGNNAVSNISQAMNGGLSGLASGMVSIGVNIVQGLKNGIANGWATLTSFVSQKATELLNSAKATLGIHSPSTKFKWIGEMCVAGFDEGIQDLMSADAIMSNLDTTIAGLTVGATGVGSTSYQQIVNINQPITTADELARKLRTESRYGLMKGVAFG